MKKTKTTMGLTYTNVILYKVEQQTAVNVLKKQGRNAYVSSRQGDFTVVYDKESENHQAHVIETFSVRLTKELGCIGLTSLVLDSDVYIYWVYRNGELLDLYNSLPHCPGGDSKVLCEAFDRTSAIPEIQNVFHLVQQINQGHERFQFEFRAEDIHRAFIQALGIPSSVAFMGYNAIENADLPNEIKRDTFMKTED